MQIHPHAQTRFELTIDGADATLVESDATGSRTYRGSARNDAGARRLHLEMAGVQPLELRCAPQAMTIDGAHVDALRCGEAIQPAAGDDDDDALVFGAPPGISYTHREGFHLVH